MKRNIFTLLVLFVSFSLISVGNVFAQEQEMDREKLVKNTDWKLFSDNLVMGIKSGNLGLQVSAMQHIIFWKDKLNVEKAMPDLVKLYRNHKDESVRLMALVTINTMNNDWAKGIVKRDVAFEKSPRLKKMMYAVLQVRPKSDLALVK